MRAPLRWCAVALLLSLCTLPALAQETTGRLEGRVLDAKGQPIAEVNVSVTSPSLQGGRGCLTTARGTFVLLALPVGEYTVKLSHLAYQKQTFEGVRVRLEQTTTLGDVRLPDRVLNLPEVVVTPKRLIDPTSTEVGGVLDAKDYSALPIERDYASAVLLLPQATLSYHGDPVNVAGATGTENRYYVDGVDGTDPVYGLTGTGLPYNFIQEVELRAGGYMPEYRSALGGTINAITYSGGNELKAQAFGFYTRNRAGVDPRFRYKANRGDYALYDVGFGLGGPIRRDLLWYYLAYNPTFTREDVEIPGLGMFPDRTTKHSFAGKLTWRVDPRNTVVVTTVGDPTLRDGVAVGGGVTSPPTAVLNADAMLTDVREGRVSLAVEERSAPRQHFALRSRFSWTRFDNRYVGATERGRNEVLFIVDSTATWSGGPQVNWVEHDIVTFAGVVGTWLSQAHEIKAGLEYKDVRSSVNGTTGLVILYADGTYGQLDVRFIGQVGHRIPSAFVQDSWRMTDRLRLNAGVRWDGLYFIASDGRVAQTILDQWQPRAGIVWEPGRAGTQKLFASAGRFYHDLSTHPLFNYYSTEGHWRFLAYDHDPRIDPSGGTAWVDVPGQIQESIEGLQGQHFDELELGYERRIGRGGKLGATVTYRALRQALEDGADPVTGEFHFGNPGSGLLRDYPPARREYTALALSWQQQAGERLAMLASYVLSRNRGNYPGIFNPDFGYINANNNGSFDFLPQLVHAYGLLPNDRTHMLKLSGRFDAGGGVMLGMTAGWQSGTPLSEFGIFPGSIDPVLVTTRGTAGRTPSIWDLSLRVGYQVPAAAGARLRPRVTADFMHIGSQRKPVSYEQLHYLTGTTDWTFSDPSNRYLKPTQCQPGPAVRIGAEVEF